jgi:hypothetical protein
VSGFDVNAEVAKKAKAEGIATLGSKLIAALGQGSGANWSLSRWGKSTGKWSEKDMDVAQDAKMPMPLGGLVDQLVNINQEKMKALLS